MRQRFLLFVFFILLIQGCVNPYSKFYFDQTGGIDVTDDPKIEYTNGAFKLFRGKDCCDGRGKSF